MTEPIKQESSVPKNFVIRCHACRWARLSSGVSEDLQDLNEINKGCTTCGKWRKFHCPQCGRPAMMKRFQGNTP